MTNYEILKQANGFALYFKGELVHVYTRKDSAQRRLKKLLEAKQLETTTEAEALKQSVSVSGSLSFDLFEDEAVVKAEECKKQSSVKAVSRSQVSEFCEFLVLRLVELTKLHKEGVAQTHELTQRVQRGAARGVARSPP